MSRFVLTAQLQLQAPRNTRQVVTQMQQQLQNVNVQINPVINNQALSQANAQLTKVSASAQSVSKNLRGASRSAESFGSALGAAARRFASITLATGFFLGITRAMGSAVGRAVEFEKEMLKISQVTGKTVRGLQDLSNEVTKLSTTFGVSSEEILGAARTLSQAGLAADQVTKSLKILAQTDLAATFDNIADTTEGAVALINQFRNEVRAAGSEAKFLEKALDAINAVSKNFAVESADLISVVRRTGGVFEAAGGQLNELIALFTSVRSTTRETADTIATGFRTIFTRIQRTETIDQLRELGIVLQDSTGKFVGPLEAIKRLSAGLSALDPRDFRFNEIVEQLGGFRQIGKVIPLIKQYSTSVEALSVANNSMGSTAKDAQTAQQGLGNQFAQLKEKFDATIRAMVDSGTFRSLADGAIRLAEAVLKIVDAMEPLLPMLTALAAFKLGQIAVPALGRFAGVTGKNQGGRIHGFNRGGYVPGTGNRDTVPAMLTPGEFVIRKSSVKKIGASRLAEMNGYTNGTTGRGVPRKSETTMGSVSLAGDEEVDGFEVMGGGRLPGVAYTASKGTSGGVTRLFGALPPAVYKKYGQKLEKSPAAQAVGMGALGPEDHIVMNVPFINAPANESLQQSGDPEFIQRHLRKSVKSMAKSIGKELDFDVPPHLTFDETKAADSALASIDLNTISGLMFEAVTSMLSGAPLAEARGGWDMPNPKGYQKQLEKLFDAKSMKNIEALELKKTFGTDQISGKDGSMTTKVLNTLIGESNKSAANFGFKIRRTQGTPDSPAQQSATQAALSRAAAAGMSGKFFGGRIGAYNSGGQVDTVPAMLTPGEYVINKKSAQQIGYGNLNRMNKQGVAKFNKGGPVQFFNKGTTGAGVPGGAGMNVGAGVNTSMEALASSATKLSYQLDTIASSISSVVDDFAALQNIDDKINGAADTLANSIASAVDDINVLQSIDEKLVGAVQPLANSITGAAGEVTKGVQNFAAGMSTIDDTFKTQIESTVSAVKTSMGDFAKGLATIDDNLKQQFTAPGELVEKAMGELTKHLTTFGTELVEKVKLFDTLNEPIGATAAAMEKFDQQLLARLDDLNPMSSGAVFMGEALTASGQLLAEVSIAVADALGASAVNFVKGITNAITGIGGAGNTFASLQGAAGPFSASLGKGISAMTHFTQFMGQLNGAIIQMTQSLQNGNIAIGQTATAAFDTDEFFTRLEASIQQFITQMQTAGAAAGKAGTAAAATGGAATGGAVMAGGGGGGKKDLAGSMNNLMMAGMMAGMLAQQMSFLGDKTQKAVMDFTMLGSILGMVALSAAPALASALFKQTSGALINAAADAEAAHAASLRAVAEHAATNATQLNITEKQYETITSKLNADAKTTEMIATNASTAAEARKAAVLLGVTLALAAIALVATVVIMRMNALQERSKELTKSLGESLKSMQEGNLAAMNVAQGHRMIREALEAEAAAAEGGFTAMLVGITLVVGALAAIVLTGGGAAVAFAAMFASAKIATAAAITLGAALTYGAYEAGAAFATAEEAALGLGESLVTGAVLASQALGSLSLASKAAELAQLSGADALDEINDRYENISGTAESVIQSMISTAGLRAGIGANTEFTTEEMMDSDALKKATDMSEDALQKLTEQMFDTANKLRAAGAEQVDAMLAQGMDVDKVLNTAAIRRNFANLADSVSKATRMHLLTTGAMKIAAKAQLGLAGVSDEQMTAEQRQMLALTESHMIAEEANKTARETIQAEKDRIRAADAARKKQDALEARELAASQEAARSAYALAQSFNAAQTGLLNLNNSFNAVNVTFSRLSGSITQFKSNLDKQIATLATGDLTTENVGAAKAVGDAFGIGAQVDSLLGSIKETENVRKVLIEKGTKEFTGKLSETAASLRWEDFLAANNLDLSMLSDDIQGEIKEMLEDGLQPDEIETIVGHINDANEKQVKLLQELANAQQKYLTTIFKFGGAIIKAEQQFRSAMVDLVKVTQTGAERMAKALGRDLTVKEVGRNEAAMRNARLGDLAGGGVAKTGADLGAREAAMASIDKQIRRLSESAGNEEQIIKLQNRQRELGDESDRLRGHLKALSDQSKLAAAVMKEIDKEGQKRAAVVGFIDDFTFATNKERGEINKGVMALQRVMQTGTLASIPDDMRGAVSGLLDQFSDIAIGPQGQTGDEVRRFLQVQTANQMSMMARGRPLTAEEADKIFNKTTREEELINTLQAISQQEQAAARELAQHQLNKQDELVRTLQELVVELRNKMMTAGEAVGPAVEANPFALGGVVYASEGKSIFKPRGTDTVPAMLTPGEFVVNKQAASRNRGALNAINSGKTQYLAGGGSVGTLGSYNKNYDEAFKKNYDPTIIKDMATSAGERAGKLAQGNIGNANDSTRGGFSADFIRSSLPAGEMWPFSKLPHDVYKVTTPGWKGAVSLNNKTLQSYRINAEAFKSVWHLLGQLNQSLLSQPAQGQHSIPPDLGGLPTASGIYDYYNKFRMHAGYWYNGGWMQTPIDPTEYDLEAYYGGATTAGQLYDDAAEFLTYAGESKQRKWAAFQRTADEQANNNEWAPLFVQKQLMNSIFGDGTTIPAFIQRVAMNPDITSDDDDDVSAGKYGYAPKPAWTKGTNPQPQFQFNDNFIAKGRHYLKPNEIKLQDGVDPDIATMLTQGFIGNTKPGGFFEGLADKQSSLLKVVYGKYADYLNWHVKTHTPEVMDYLRGDFSLFPTDKMKGTKEIGNVAAGQLAALMQPWSVQEWFKSPSGVDAIARSKELHPAMQLVTDLGNNFLNAYLANPSSWQEDAAMATSYAGAGQPIDSLGMFSAYSFGMQGYGDIVAQGNKKLTGAAQLWNKMNAGQLGNANDAATAKQQRENFAALMENITKPFGISFNAKGRLKEAEKQKNEQQQAAAKEDAEEKQAFLAENKKLNANLDFGIFNDRAGFMKQAQDFMMENKLFQYRTPSYPFKYGLPKFATRLHRVPPTAGSFNALFPYSMFIAKELQNFSRGNLLLGMGADNVSLNKALIRQSLGNVVRDQAGNIVWEATINPQTGVGSADLNAAIKTVNKQGQWSRLFFNGGRQFFGPRGVLGTFTGKPYEDWFTGIGGYKGLTDDEKQIAALYFKDPSFTNGGFAGAMVKELQGLWKELTDTYKAQAAILKQRPGAQPQVGAAQAAGNFATGGPVGVSFKPKGTDTVPAMLTPGEFVMRKSAVDKYGVGFMSAINGGGVDNTGPYFSAGGRAVSQFGAPIDRRLDKVLNTVKSNSTDIKEVKDSVSKITNNTANIAAKTSNNDLLADQETAKAILRQAQSNRSGIQENNDDIADINSSMLTSSEYESLFEQVKKLKKRLKKAIPEMKDLSRDLGAAQGALNQILFLVQNQDLARAPNFAELAAQIAANAFNPGAFFAKGGSVPGVGNQDTVSAMLTPGEFVMKKSAVGKYGKSFMSAINSGAIPQMFAEGGPVIDPMFWTTNDMEKEDPAIAARWIREFSKGNTPLFGADVVRSYIAKINDQGRGVWNRLPFRSGFDPNHGKYKYIEDVGSNKNGLYVKDTNKSDGYIYAFSLTRDEDAKNLDFGGYLAGLPRFGLSGPFMFTDVVADPGGPIGAPGAIPVAGSDTMPLLNGTGPMFASLWAQYSQQKKLPGFDGAVRRAGMALGEMGSFTFSDGLAQQAAAFLVSTIKSGRWNPAEQIGAFGKERVAAGWKTGYPMEVLKMIEDTYATGALPNDFGSFDASYFAKGGAARGTDTVPAMLTPGEFVMKKSAVQKYGLGFMRAINDSGPSTRVGRGVQYKHEGDVMGAGGGFDFSGLSNSIGELGSQVSTSLSAFESAFLGFSKLSSLLSDTINSIADLNITHTVNISGSLSIPGFSQQAINDIVKVISDQIAGSTDGKIKRALRRFKRDQDNRT